MANKLLAQKIKQLRHRKAWSQSHLAEAARLSVRTIQRLEKNGECSQETLLSVASALDVDVKNFTKMIRYEPSEANSPNKPLLGINQHKDGLWFSLRNWFSNKKQEWQRLMAITGGFLLILPVSFLTVGVIKYTMGFNSFPDPFEMLYTTDALATIWNTISPVIFIGSLAIAFGLNLFPFLDFDLANKEDSLLSSIRYQGNGWNWTILLMSLCLIVLMLGYAAAENIAEHAVKFAISG